MSGVTLGYDSDKGTGDGTVKGSDARLNVSSRSDSRLYYNSRDESLSFSLNWDDASTATGDYVAMWVNTHTEKTLVVEGIEIGSQYASNWQIQSILSPVAGGGTAATPVCVNRGRVIAAQATARTAVSATVTIGGSIESILSHGSVGDAASGGRFWDLHDSVRIGPGGAFALQCILSATSPGLTQGSIVAYYEED